MCPYKSSQNWADGKKGECNDHKDIAHKTEWKRKRARESRKENGGGYLK